MKNTSLLTLCLLVTLLLVSSCAATKPKYSQIESQNKSERIKFLVMHYTAINYQQSLEALVDEGGLSSHYLVPENDDPTYPFDELKILQLVDENDRAWHAGQSYWQGRRDLNDQSIGIEIVNVPSCKYDSNIQDRRQEHGSGRLCLFPDFDPEQIQLVIELSLDILARNPDIGPTQVIGHSDIAPNRKNDPGPRFPWQQLYQAGIGAWYEDETVEKYWVHFNQQLPSTTLLQKAFRAYGYGQQLSGRLDEGTLNTVSAFQMHFLPWKVTGRPDSQTAATLFALIDRYFPDQAADLMKAYEAELIKSQIVDQVRVQIGQIDSLFSDLSLSDSPLLDNRHTFKSYAGRGRIIIENQDAESAEISINGQMLSIANPLQPYHEYDYSLARRTLDGNNLLQVQSVLPKGSQIKVRVPYPELIDSTSSSNNRFKTVDKLINDDVKKGFPGAVLLVVKDGQIIKRSAYGYARKYKDGGETLSQFIPMQSDTLFDLASNSKMFATNLALMKLVSEGKLDVNQSVSYYLPDFQGGGREAILVRDLLTHKSGFAPEVRFFDRNNPLGAGFFSQNRKRTERLLLTRVPLETASGETVKYSDTNYMLLGILVEHLTGQTLDDYVEHEIYQPLGLTDTLFNPLNKGFAKSRFAATEIQGNTRDNRFSFDNIRQHVLQGEVHDEKAFYSSAGVAGHAGLFATADDLAVLSQMLLNKGGYGNVKLINNQVIDSFIKPEEDDATIGLGWRRAGNGERVSHFGPYASEMAYGHTGWTGTVTLIDPVHDLAIIYLTNFRHSPVIENDENGLSFEGRLYDSANYGNLVSLVYEAVLKK